MIVKLFQCDFSLWPQVMILHPGFLKYIQERWLQKHGRYPSTGFITLIFALHICDQVKPIEYLIIEY